MKAGHAMPAPRSGFVGRRVSPVSRRLIAAAGALALALFATHGHGQTTIGPVGGAGGGETRVNCPENESIVGFDVKATHVITRIAAVCSDTLKKGTVGTPWVGSEVEVDDGKGGVKGATLHKPRCDPGSILTILHVFWDGTPLVNKLGFTCFNPKTGRHNNHLPTFGGKKVHDIRLVCEGGEVGTGIVVRAGTAIDALGLICSKTRSPSTRPKG